MRILVPVVLIFGLLFLSSCSPSAGIVGDRSKLYFDGPDAATVTVMRKDQLTGAAVRVTVSLDHEVIAYIGAGDRIEFQVRPGEHYVAVFLRNIWGQEPERFVRFDAEAMKKYYFYYSMDLSNVEIFKLVELTPVEGEKELATNKYELISK